MTLRNVLVCMGLMITVVIVLIPLRWWWFQNVLVGRSFPVTWEWLDLASLGVWAFEFAWSIVVGVVVVFLVRSRRRVLWAVACGALGGLAEFLIARHDFAPFSPWTTYVWAYGAYFVPVVGAGLAAAAVSAFLPRNEGGTPSAA
jgi:CDP-diglyceride synthetase